SEIIFYRLGFYSNFSSTIAPPKRTSIYAEVSYLPNTSLDKQDILKDVFDGLKSCGFLKNERQVIVKNILDIPYAYVIHDDFRHKNLPKIISYLNSQDIFSIGRYGNWKYASMEDTLLQGKEIAGAVHE
ncbi:MAG: protoporphyrinogen oxidase, partial [Deltaproteobacteria bacterium]|nr:protoporphyrinogen oxidase [Deltaproteobacteria bacterium]